MAQVDRVSVVTRALRHVDDGGVYLEIGVRAGATFRAVQARAKIAVDPHYASRRLHYRSLLAPVRAAIGRRSGDFIFELTSDEFFARHRRFLRSLRLNAALVDGLHTSEQAFRDALNSLAVLAKQGVVVMHDCNPLSRVAALPDEHEARQHPEFAHKWNGDVWKAIVRLRATRSDLRVCVLDTDHGLGIVARGKPDRALDLNLSDIDRMTYDDLASHRQELLDLRPSSEARSVIENAMEPY